MADVFQRRHYIELASIIAAIKDVTTRTAMVSHFTKHLSARCPSFNPVLFAADIPGTGVSFVYDADEHDPSSPATVEAARSARLKKGSSAYYAAVEQARMETGDDLI